MSKRFPIGFIGGGIDSAIGLTHYISSMMDDKFQLVAGAFSRDEVSNFASGSKYFIDRDRVYEDWRMMLQKERGRLNAICILSPIPNHFEMIISALNLGYSVISEKSLSDSSDNVKKILECRRKTNNFLSVTYNYVGFPMLLEMSNIISSGKIGRILHFSVEMPQEGFLRLSVEGAPTSPQKWRLQDGKIPTVYLDLGVHMHHLVNFLINRRPIAVSALNQSYGNFNVIDNVSAIVEYENSIMGNFWFGKSSLGHRNGLRIRIYGSEGSCEWAISDPECLIICDSKGGRLLVDNGGNVEHANKQRFLRFKPGHPSGYIEAFANVYSNIEQQFNQYINSGMMPAESEKQLDVTLEGMYFLEAMANSAKTGKLMKLNYA